MFKKRLLLILFLATVLVYAVTLFWSIHNYEEWKKNYLESIQPEFRGYIDFRSYMDTKQGRPMILLGFVIGVVWVVGIGFLGKYMEHRDLRLLSRIVPICGFLCFYSGIMAGFYYEESSIFGVVAAYRNYRITLVALGIIFIAISPVILANTRKR